MSTVFTPRPYQVIARDFLVNTPRCALFAGMGLGKSASTLLALDTLSLVEDVFPVLIIAPLRVARKTWREEVAKWSQFSGMTVSQIIGTPGEREVALMMPADIYTINYENLVWLLEQCPTHWIFKTIVCDESSKLKNFRGSIQTSATGKKFVRVDTGKRTGALARVAFKTPRFVELTGTPASNGIVNLWSQLWFLDQGDRLGRTFGDFAARWFKVPPSGYGLEPLPHAQAEVQDKIRDICLTINPADWFDLQAPIHRVIEVEMTGRARKLYQDMEDEMYLDIANTGVEALNAAACTIKCLQLANGAIYTDESGNWAQTHDEKLLALREIVDEAGGMPVIVAYQFKSDLARLQKAFPEGRLLKTQRDEDDFKAGKIPVLFAHPASAGHGIDGFQYVSNIIAFYGQWWDLELRQQIIERIGPVRQIQAGMNRPVFIYDIVAKDTVDELVMQRHATKRAVQDILLESLNRKKVIA
jgi:SNF2 family DNA or RNA helicase